MKKYLFIDTFWLKLLALITMTLCHIGIGFLAYYPSQTDIYLIGKIFIYISRISFPIFAFCIVNSLFYTKSKIKYLMRMLIMSLIILIASLILQYSTDKFNNFEMRNLFLTFTLSVLFIYLLERKETYFKLMSVLPFIYVLLSFLYNVMYKNLSFRIPYGLLPDYCLYGFSLIVIPYFILKYFNTKVDIRYKETSIDLISYKQTNDYKMMYNLIYAIALIVISLIFSSLKYISHTLDVYNDMYQSYAILAFIPILFYNHKLGYYNKYIKYGFYIYYFMHIILINVIFLLI